MPRKPGTLPESPHKASNFRKFKTVNTQPSRTALKSDEFAWLENLMPIGDANLPVIPAVGTIIATISDSTTSTITNTGGPGSPIFTRYFGVMNGQVTQGAGVLHSEWGIYGNGGTRYTSLANAGNRTFDYGSFTALFNITLTDQNGFISTKLLAPDTRGVMAVDFTVTNSIIAMAFAAGPVFAGEPGQNHCFKQVDIIRSADGTNWVFVETATAIAAAAENQWGPTWTITPRSLPAPHQYWRLANWTNVVSGITHGFAICEAHLYSNTTKLTDLATKSTNFTISSGVLANLFDEDTATLLQVGTGNLPGGWIMYDFGTPTYVDGIRIGTGGDIDLMPVSIDLEYSDDTTTWVFAGRAEALGFYATRALGLIARLYE